MEPFIPWEFFPSLMSNRLETLAAAIKTARDSVVPLHDTDSGDSNWSLHCRGYSRQCHAIRQLSKEASWLTVSSTSPNDLELSFRVGKVPMKIVRGDREEPTYRHRDFSQGEQTLMEAIMEELPPGPLRLIVATNAFGQVNSVSLVELDEHTPIRYYEIPINDDDTGAFPIPSPDAISPTPIQPHGQPFEQQNSPSA
jgi:hypothetical protein